VAVIGGEPVLGFALALGAAACYDTGYALQAIEARRAPGRHAGRLSLLGHLLRRPLWVGATLLSLVGWPLQVLALTHAPLTLVQPVLALGLVLLLVLGARMLGERVGRREIIAVGLIVGAVAVIATAAPEAPGAVDRGAGFIAVLAGLGAVAIAPYAVALARGLSPAALLVIGAGAADGLAAFVAKVIAEETSASHWGVALAWVGLVAAVIVLGVVSEATALQRAAATRVAPTVLAMQIVIPVVLAPLVGGEGWSATPLGGAVLGLALAVVGGAVALLASSPAVAGVIAESDAAPGERAG
jgi:drug/metabolite transporter (DMT)-like permease